MRKGVVRNNPNPKKIGGLRESFILEDTEGLRRPGQEAGNNACRFSTRTAIFSFK
jgi:hypothetical protein